MIRFTGKGFDLLLLIPDEPEGADGAAIREGDVPAVRFQLPARLLVLNGAIVMLETGIAFLAGFVVLAIVIEPFDGEPGARGRGLPGLGIEPAGKWKDLRKLGTQALQVVLARPACVYPEAECFVPDELDDADGLLDGGILRLCSVYLILVDQHCLCVAFPFSSSPFHSFLLPELWKYPDPCPTQGTALSSPA